MDIILANMDSILHLCIINLRIIFVINMRKEENPTKMVLKNHYESLSRKDKIELRNMFLHMSGVSLPSFYNKMENDSFKPLERELLEKLFNDKQSN